MRGVANLVFVLTILGEEEDQMGTVEKGSWVVPALTWREVEDAGLQVRPLAHRSHFSYTNLNTSRRDS